jgi:hypothetical protein
VSDIQSIETIQHALRDFAIAASHDEWISPNETNDPASTSSRRSVFASGTGVALTTFTTVLVVNVVSADPVEHSEKRRAR